METWIRRACRQRTWRTLIAWVFLTVAVIAGNVMAGNYWRNFFAGPYPLTPSELQTIVPGGTDRQFVSVTGEKVVDSGVQEITTESRNGVKGTPHPTANYYVMVVGDRLLVVKAKEEPPPHVEGEIRSAYGIAKTMLPDASDEGLRMKILPVMLDTTDNYRAGGYIAITVMLFFCFLLWRFAWPAWRYTRNITFHPVVQRVESWSDALEVAVLAERELNAPVKYKSGGISITDTFAIRNQFFGFNLLPLSHLVWAYRKETQRYYYFIPTGRTIEAVLIFYGGSISLQGKAERVNELLQYAASRAPWAVLGHTPELATVWRKDTAAFCATVEERRRAYELQEG